MVQGLIGGPGPGVVLGSSLLHIYVAFRDNYSSTLYSPQWTELARESIKLVLDAVKKTENWAAKESCLQLSF